MARSYFTTTETSVPEAVCKVLFSLYAARTKKTGVPLAWTNFFDIQQGLDKGWSGKAVHSGGNPPPGLL
ncbi:Hypothetical protein FKW44_011234 [Caligus rogercresseyi]|uniref:Uncharacterized protein n=1 Tax=Caligus rogercresseyi TaxID=217165 RepID=A0A7T8HHP9_CALRO|nr:Hypothetical protein FKW44_011234 [Caligus rogercresseyi]